MTLITPESFATQKLGGTISATGRGLVVKTSILGKDLSCTQDMLRDRIDDLIALQELAFTNLIEKGEDRSVWSQNCEKILENGKRLVSKIRNGEEKKHVADNIFKFGCAYYAHLFGKEAYKNEEQLEIEEELEQLEKQVSEESKVSSVNRSVKERVIDEKSVDEELKALEEEVMEEMPNGKQVDDIVAKAQRAYHQVEKVKSSMSDPLSFTRSEKNKPIDANFIRSSQYLEYVSAVENLAKKLEIAPNK